MKSQSVVIDSSVCVKWFTLESDTTQARLVFQDYESGTVDLLAPEVIYPEFGNIIWKKQIFQGLPATEAKTALDAFQEIVIRSTSTKELLNDAFEIAVKHKRSFYDSLYLALSVRENCAFITADAKLVNAVKADFPKIILLADWK